MTSKKQNHQMVKRQQRKREKNVEIPLGKSLGHVCRKGWGCGVKYRPDNGKYNQEDENSG